MRNRAKFLSVLLAAACVMSGCASQSAADETGVVSESFTQKQTEYGTSAETTISLLDTSDMFSDRDKEIGYDESESIEISLAGTSTSATDSSVVIEGSKVKITKEGTYVISGSLTDGSIVIEATDQDKIQLVLDSVEITSSDYAAIYVKEADKVFVTLASGTINTLSNTGEFVQTDDNTVDGVIFSKADLTLNGEGSLVIETANGHGIVSKDDLVVTSGTYDITASGHGLAGKDSVRVANGKFAIQTDEDAIHSSNSEDAEKGYVYIADGTMQISAGDDAIHAETKLLIEGGDIDVASCYEGLEAITIDVLGGTINIVASDDGLNAAGGNDQSGSESGWGKGMMEDINEDAYINIAGGKLHIDAKGDGVDSNGSLFVSGGETYVVGPTNSGNGALDYAIDGQISGGVFVATGMSGMAMNFGSSSTQGAILYNMQKTQAAGTAITLTDADGNVMFTYDAEREFNSVVLSCTGITTDATYTLTVGENSEPIEMTEIIYGESSDMGGRGGFGGMFGGGRGDGSRGEKGQRPDMNNGEVPELPDGEMPTMPDGEMLEMPNGEMPEMPNGEMPEMPNGEMPEMPNGEMPEMPNGEMPEMPNGERPQMPNGDNTQTKENE